MMANKTARKYVIQHMHTVQYGNSIAQGGFVVFMYSNTCWQSRTTWHKCRVATMLVSISFPMAFFLVPLDLPLVAPDYLIVGDRTGLRK